VKQIILITHCLSLQFFCFSSSNGRSPITTGVSWAEVEFLRCLNPQNVLRLPRAPFLNVISCTCNALRWTCILYMLSVPLKIIIWIPIYWVGHGLIHWDPQALGPIASEQWGPKSCSWYLCIACCCIMLQRDMRWNCQLGIWAIMYIYRFSMYNPSMCIISTAIAATENINAYSCTFCYPRGVRVQTKCNTTKCHVFQRYTRSKFRKLRQNTKFTQI